MLDNVVDCESIWICRIRISVLRFAIFSSTLEKKSQIFHVQFIVDQGFRNDITKPLATSPKDSDSKQKTMK